MQNRNIVFNFVQKSIDDGPFLAKTNVCFENIKLRNRNQFDNIKDQIDKFLNGNADNRFVYLSGIRGIGKTTLMFQLFNYLIDNGVNKERMLYFSADKLKQLLNHDVGEVIEAYVNDYYGVFSDIDERIFIFVDEVQEFPDCFNQVKNIYNSSNNIFLFFAGNREIDSFDSQVTANVQKVDIHPLNYGEYLSINYGVNIDKRFSSSIINTIFTGKLNSLPDFEKAFYKSFKNRDLFMNKSLEHYLLCGSFPEAMNLNVYLGHKQIYNNLIDIIEKDIFLNGPFLPDTRDKIYRIMSFLAFEKSSNFTHGGFAKFVKLSYSHLFKVLDYIENLNLIFHIKPYEGKKGIRKSRSYYFISPNFHAAINSQIGEFTPKDVKYLEVLVESYVASSLFRMKNACPMPFEIYVPNGKKHANFMIISQDDEIIPIEIAFGRKPEMNIINTLGKYDCEYGVIISDAISGVRKSHDLIHIPITTFSLI